jgi:hypothetical protein
MLPRPSLRATPPWGAPLLAAALLHAGPAGAQFKPEAVVHEPAAMAERFPDPAVRYDTPAFRPGRADFTAHAEVMAFAEQLQRESPHARLEIAGRSQDGLPLPLLLLSAWGTPDPARPTVMVIAQQHGNEPAGGEAALALARLLAGPRWALLDRVNVLILPRANPDGAERFGRATTNGIDVNRDHLLLRTPEAQAIARVIAAHRPQVVLDLHEFTVAGRWVDKFGAMQKLDAQVQPATVGNLHAGIAQWAGTEFVERLHAEWAAHGLASGPYHTSSSAKRDDRTVSMGGVQPDTGRNTAGLRPAISLLVEVRGVGLGRAHLARRVHAHVVAASTVIDTAAALGPRLVDHVRRAERDTAARACRGELVIAARHTPTRQTLTLLDARTGADLALEVDWRAAEPLHIERTRPWPCGYLLEEKAGRDVLDRLALLGARWQPVQRRARWQLERYVVTSEASGQRQDARGTIDDGGSGIRALQVRTEPVSETVEPGMVYVPLDQPLAPLIAAALEPDSQSSWAASRLLDIGASGLRRVREPPRAAWLGAR